jgi:OOP family OmpA-OmpF porin
MTARFRTRRGSFAVALIATLAVALALAGCGGSSHPPRTTTQSATGPGTASASATTPASPPTPLASTSYDTFTGGDPTPITVSIDALRRAGPFLDLYFTYTCNSSGDELCGVAYGTEMHDGPAGEGTYADQLPDGVALVDPVNAQVYYPIRDANGDADTSTAPYPRAGQTNLSWVRFPAPPAGVSSLDITFPYGPSFTNVPVGSGSVPTAPPSWQVNPANTFSQARSSTNTSGLTLPISPMSLEIADTVGSDRQAGTKSEVSLSSDVLFAFAKATLTAKAATILGSVAATIKARAVGQVQVTGYTDSIGSAAVNDPLSLHRAEAVIKALKPLTPGISYTAEGRGAADPVAPNSVNGHDDPAGRAQNRRVTIAFTAKRSVPPTAPPQPATDTTGTGNPTSASSFTFPEDLSLHEPPGSVYRGSDISLTREGNLLDLEMTLTCVKADEHSCNLQNDLGGTGQGVPPFGTILPETDEFSTSAFYLEDPSTGTSYLPARDSYGNPLDDYIDALSAGDSFRFWAYFPAPPGQVSALKLLAPAALESLLSVPKSTGSIVVPITPAPSGIGGSGGAAQPTGTATTATTTSTAGTATTGTGTGTSTAATVTTATTTTVTITTGG